MFRPGHYGMAMFCYAFVAFWLFGRGYHREARWGMLVVLVVTMYPDVDSRFAYIPHRQITHTVWFAILVGLGCAAVVAAGALYRRPTRRRGAQVVGGAFSFGTFSVIVHLAADALNPWGVMPFYPVTATFVSLDLVRASNATANYAMFAAGTAALTASWFAGTVVAKEDVEPYAASVTTVKRWYSFVTSGR